MGSGLKEFLKGVGPLRASVLAARDRRAQMELARARRQPVYQAQIDAYLAQEVMPRLQIGSGRNFIEGWLNTDYAPEDRNYVFLDATKTFPLPSNTFDLTYSEHIIEHIPFQGGENLARESFRILKPGGTMRVATPDLSKFLGLFGREHTEFEKEYMKWGVDTYYPGVGIYNPCMVLNNFVRQWDHLFIYDPDTMKLILERAGFVNVRHCEVGESTVPGLQNIERHAKIIGDAYNRFETMVHEGTKP